MLALLAGAALGGASVHHLDGRAPGDRLATQVAAVVRAELAAARPEPARAELAPSRCALDPDAIQAIVAAARPVAPPPARPAESVDPSPQPPRSLEAEKELAHAEEVLDTALSRGRLSLADDVTIRHAFSRFGSAEEDDQLRRRISVAINLGKLVPEMPVVPR